GFGVFRLPAGLHQADPVVALGAGSEALDQGTRGPAGGDQSSDLDGHFHDDPFGVGSPSGSGWQVVAHQPSGIPPQLDGQPVLGEGGGGGAAVGQLLHESGG